MDAIYEEMSSRNISWLKDNAIIADPLLLTPEVDDRKCIALVVSDEIEIVDIADIEEICQPYNDCWMRPRVHSTFMVLRGWRKTSFQEEDWTPLRNIINTMSPYEIIFDRVIPVRTGLVLCGIPSINVNELRDKMRDAGYETDSLYKCDIVHTTLLRWTHGISNDIKTAWLNKILSLPKKTYAKLMVTGFHIIEASWSMIPNTFKILESLKF